MESARSFPSRRGGEAADHRLKASRGDPALRWSRAAFGLALAFGSLFAVVTPPAQAPDEAAHLRRAFALSEGRLLARKQGGRVGADLPASVEDLSHGFQEELPFHPERKTSLARILGGFRVPLRPDERRFTGFPNTALYGWVAYAPQALAIAFARLVTPSLLAIWYAARLANAAAAAALLGLAVRETPFFRPVFFLVGLAPMAVFLDGSLSADAVTNGIAFLLTASVLRSAFGRTGRLEPRELWTLVALSVLLALCKPGYLLLSCLVFLIPARRFGSASRYARSCGLVVLSAAGATAAWAATLYGRGLVGGAGLGSEALVSRLGPIVAAILRDYVLRAPQLAVQVVGNLGWADVSLPIVLVAAYGLVALLVALTGGSAGAEIPARGRVLLAAVVGATALIVAAPFHVAVLPPGPEGASAHHPQGRYLLAVGPAALLLLSNRRWRFDWEGRAGALTAWVALVLGVAVVSVVRRYYV